MPDDERAAHRRTDFEWFDFWYQNEHKIDALFSGLNGRIETERKESVSKGVGGTGRLGFELGGLLAAVGLAKGKVEGELRSDYAKILEVTTSLSIENKIGLLLAFFTTEGELSELELAGGEDELLQAIRKSRFQLLLGRFDYVATGDDRYELQSERRNAVGDALIRVPLLNDNMTPNQATQIVFWEEGEAWPHEVFARCIVRPNWVLANPIAIWLPDEVESAEAVWSTGLPVAGTG
jgi:hypothetical protein